MQGGCVEVVQYLVEQACVDLEKADVCGRSPLVRAAEYGQTRIVGILIKCGASIRTEDGSGTSALAAAVDGGYADIVQMFILKGIGVKP